MKLVIFSLSSLLSSVALLPQVPGMQGQLQNLQNPMQNQSAEPQGSGEVTLPFPCAHCSHLQRMGNPKGPGPGVGEEAQGMAQWWGIYL